MSRRKLCVDIDNVIAATDDVMRRVVQEYTEGKVNLARADVKEFDYSKCVDCDGHGITREQWTEIHEVFSEPKWILAIRPLEGAQQCLVEVARNFDVHFVTSRLPKAWEATIEWLRKHGFPLDNLHFVKNGRKHETLRDFALTIEDHYEQAAAFASAGIPCYLICHPWNENKPKQESIEWVAGWEELAERLRTAE